MCSIQNASIEPETALVCMAWFTTAFGQTSHVSVLQECARAVLIFAYGLLLVRVAGRRIFGKWAAIDIIVSIIDLPIFGSFKSAGDGAQVTDRLLDGFQRHHWKVTGFVNEVQLEAADKPLRVALLEHWLDAGMDLGNHTYSHVSLNAVPVDAYIANIAQDEAQTGSLLAAQGRRERWFRYPYLETGPTRASATE